jgi:hypothetical protein
MSSTATLSYKAFLGGASAAQVIALMSAVPVPKDALSFLGVRVISDSTVGAGPVIRTITLGLNPVAAATATASLVPGDGSGSPLAALTVTSPGSGYVIPPIVSFSGGRLAEAPQVQAFTPDRMARQHFTTSPGNPEAANQRDGSFNAPAHAEARLKVVSATVTAGGSGYGPNTFILVQGGLARGGRKAVLIPTIALGVVTGVVVTDPGSGYTSVPSIAVVDPGATPGSGAVVTVSMGLDLLLLTQPGAGFTSAPSVILTPYFQAVFPPTGDQSAPFRNLLNTALEQATLGPVSASPPVIA